MIFNGETNYIKPINWGNDHWNSPGLGSIVLPSHKADPFFKENHIIIKRKQYCNLNPLAVFQAYWHSHNALFSLSLPLWVTSKGTVSTRYFFISQMQWHFDHDIAGQSMRAGGATSLAENRVPPSLIQPHRLLVIWHIPDLHAKKSHAYSSTPLLTTWILNCWQMPQPCK